MPTFKSIKLMEAQKIILVPASKHDNDEFIDPAHTGGIGSNGAAENYGLSANELRSITALHRKGMFEGPLEDLSSLKLTAHAFNALHIDVVEWLHQLRDSEPTVQTNDNADAEAKAAVTTALRKGTKGAAVLALLKRKKGVTLNQMEEATGWQHHSIKGFLSGTARKKLGLELTSEKASDGTRVYRIANES